MLRIRTAASRSLPRAETHDWDVGSVRPDRPELHRHATGVPDQGTDGPPAGSATFAVPAIALHVAADVPPLTAVRVIVPRTAVEMVVADVAEQPVVAGAPELVVVAVGSDQRVVATPPGELVGRALAVDQIAPGASGDHVRSQPGADDVVASSAPDAVGTPERDDHVPLWTAAEPVTSSGPDDR